MVNNEVVISGGYAQQCANHAKGSPAQTLSSMLKASRKMQGGRLMHPVNDKYAIMVSPEPKESPEGADSVFLPFDKMGEASLWSIASVTVWQQFV